VNGSSEVSETGAWLFQANPAYYDIRAAVAELSELNWTTAQYQNQISAGSAVYLWESGPGGGVLARGEIITDPSPMPDEEGEKFIRDPSKFEGDTVRVRLRIDDVLDTPIGRATLKAHPVLHELDVLGFPNGTNFRISADERDALDALFEGVPGADLCDRLEEILDSYSEARATGVFGSASPIWQAFESLTDALNHSRPLTSRATVAATWSAGIGNWARVPWVAMMNSRETTTTQRGVYPVWLFRQDMTGVYLTLAQGVTEPKKRGRAEAVAYLQGVAQRVREKSPELADAGFLLDSNIDLHADPGLGKDYEISTIAHKFYASGSVPADHQLLTDLEAVLAVYDRYVEEGTGTNAELVRLATQFRRDRPYPTESDKANIAAREDLANALSRENLEAVEREPMRWDTLRFTHLAGSAYGGPGPQSRVHSEVQRGDDAKQRIARALRHVLYDTGGDEAQRIDDVLSDDNWRVYGLGETLLVKALAVVKSDRWLPVFPYSGSKGKKRLAQAPVLGIEPFDEDKLETTGRRTAEANRRLREVLEPVFPADAWAQAQFLYWLRDRAAAEEAPVLGLSGLAEELLLDEQWLEDTVELLRDKRQLILYGPPGTGKTYVARKLAQHIAQDPSRLTVVQFHPSYSYEDFVEGYRPVPSGHGSVAFELRHGPLRRMAEAADDSEADWCLLIDEINRGNIAKVFGELYYLLEYRDDQVELQYGESFQLPRNLYVIGTMNTADRSIALLDAALRRRFHFVAFFPDQAPIAGLLRRWLVKKHPDMEYVADVVDRANALLPDRHLQIGPSHFMTPRLNREWLHKIWRGSVLPYIEEQFFDEPEMVKQFELDRLLSGESPVHSAIPPTEDLDENEAADPDAAGMGDGDRSAESD
jgi:MoxR-like ATPase